MSNTSDQTTKPSKTRLIVGEVGVDTETGIIGKGHSYDNGKTFTVDDTIYGRIYHADDHDKIWKGIQDQVVKVVDPAKSAADSAVSAADAAVASAQVTSDAVSAIASATAEAKQGANEAMSRALSAWDVATGAKEAVTDFDPLLKSAQSDAKQANNTASSAYEQSRSAYDAVKADSSAVVAMQSSVADFQEDVSSAQSVADSAKADAGKALTQIADNSNALSDAKTAFNSGVAEAKELANTAQTTANSAIKSAVSVASDLTVVASQAKSNASGITKVTSDVGLLQTTVADNSGNISKIQETAAQIQQAVSDNSGAIVTATQTAQSAVTVASDAKSNATVAIQTASQASITASNASGQAASAVITANGALTTASNAKSDATVAVQTASGASLTATNAQSDATIAKQTASEATIQASNAESDFAQISIRANKIEANVANNSGAIASVQQTANGLTTTVADITRNGGGTNILRNTDPIKIDNIQSSSTWVLGSGGNGQAKIITLPNVFIAENGFEIYGNTGGNRDFTQRPVPWDNAKYVFSVYAKIADMSDITSVDMMTRAWSNQVGRAVFENHHTLTSKNWVRVTMIIDASSFYTQSGVSLAFGLSGIGSIDFAEPILEKGTVAHDWSPAPDDLQDQFTQIKQSIDGVTTTVNDPKVGMTATYQTASQASLTAQNASGQAVTAVTTAQGAVTTAKNAQSDAVVAKQTASEASVTASNAAGDASVAKQTASQASISIQNARSDITSLDARADRLEAFQKDASGNINKVVSRADGVDQTLTNQKGDITNLQSRAGKLESSMSTANGQISTLQQTANGLTTTVADIKANGGGVNLAIGTGQEYTMGYGIPNTVWQDGYAYLKLPITLTAKGIEILPLDPHTFYYNLTPRQEYTQTVWLETDATVKDLSAAQITWFTSGLLHDHQSATLINLGENKYKLYSTYKWPGKSDNNVRLFDTVSLNSAFDLGTGTYLKFGKLMLEEGTVSHDWSPAPDDLQDQFTQIKTTVNGINTTINDPKTGLNVTYQTAAGNATTISNVKGDVSQLQTTANGLTSRVGSLESKTNSQQTAIDQNKSAIALKADQTTVNTLKGTVSQNTATLKTQASQIQAKVSASDVSGMLTGYATQSYTQSLVTQTANNWNLNLTKLQTDVNAIKTTGGGVNLLTNTDKDISVTSHTTDRWPAWANIDTGFSFENGKTYTFSAEAKNSTNQVTEASIRVFEASTKTQVGIYAFPADGNRHSVTFTIPNDSHDYHLLLYAGHAGIVPGVNVTTTYHHPNLEFGTVAHPWSPAPSDLATVTSVTNLSATVDGIKGTVATKADQSEVTQLSNVFQVKLQGNIMAKADNVTLTYTGKNNEFPEVTDLKNPQQATNGTKMYLSFDYTADGDCQLQVQLNDSPWTPWGDIATSPIKAQKGVTGHYFKAITVSDDSWKTTNATKLAIRSDYFNGKVTISNLLLTAGDNVQSTFDMLKDDINMRVQKGNLMSQINLEAGTALIQSNKLALDAKTTVFTGDAFIPSAAIESLDASKLTFYGANNTYATMGASVAQYDDDKQKSTINLQYNGGIEIHSSNQQGSILTMHDNTIRLASKSWGDNSNPYQYSGFYAAPNYSLMNTYHKDGTASGVAIDDNQIHIYGSSKDQQLGSLQADVGWYSINGKTGLLTGNQISLKAGNTQAVLTDNNININNVSGTNDKNYDVGIHIKGWAEMTGWFTCMGITQTSLLSTKTRIEPLDTKVALNKIASTNVETYQFKSDVANGKTKRHASVIIDDVHDVAEYYTPEEFISENRMGRDDGDIIGYLMGAVQELKKQLDELKEKI